MAYLCKKSDYDDTVWSAHCLFYAVIQPCVPMNQLDLKRNESCFNVLMHKNLDSHQSVTTTRQKKTLVANIIFIVVVAVADEKFSNDCKDSMLLLLLMVIL